MSNPWLASIVSFLPIVFMLAILFFCVPKPLPTGEGLSNMPWWAPLGGLAGAFAVICGLLFVDKIGAGAFGGLTITANILMSLAVDHFGWFGIEQHGINLWRVHRRGADGGGDRADRGVLMPAPPSERVGVRCGARLMQDSAPVAPAVLRSAAETPSPRPLPEEKGAGGTS